MTAALHNDGSPSRLALNRVSKGGRDGRDGRGLVGDGEGGGSPIGRMRVDHEQVLREG
jgi:hypothetical protein